jgi:hypothetical protein
LAGLPGSAVRRVADLLDQLRRLLSHKNVLAG